MTDILSNYVPPAPPAGGAPDKATRIARRVALINTLLTRILNTSITARQQAFNWFWDPDGQLDPDISPLDMAAAFGTSCGSLFARDWALYQFLLGQLPSAPLSQVPTGWAITTNADGTVSLTYTAPLQATNTAGT